MLSSRPYCSTSYCIGKCRSCMIFSPAGCEQAFSNYSTVTWSTYFLYHLSPFATVHVLDSPLEQPLSRSSLVFPLVLNPQHHTPCISSPNHRHLFAAHAHNLTLGQIPASRVASLCHCLFVSSSKAALDDFCKGLIDVGLLPHLVSMPQSFKPLFCCRPLSLTRSRLRDLIGVQWSDTGTNLRDSEEDTVYAWEKFLLAVEGMTLSDAHSLHNMPLTVSCFSKIQIGFTFLVPAHRVVPEKGR